MDTGRKLVLRQPTNSAVKHDFHTYIQRHTCPNENFEYGYPHSNPLLQFELELEHCMPHKATHHPTKCDVINGVKTIFHSISQDILSQIFEVSQ